MAKSAIIFLVFGVLICIGLAVWQYSIAPEGTLLYTPAPDSEPNYTSSSALGFFVGAFVFSILSGLIAVCAFAFGVLYNHRLLGLGKQSCFLVGIFAVLCVLALLTENLWP